MAPIYPASRDSNRSAWRLPMHLRTACLGTLSSRIRQATRCAAIQKKNRRKLKDCERWPTISTTKTISTAPVFSLPSTPTTRESENAAIAKVAPPQERPPRSPRLSHLPGIMDSCWAFSKSEEILRRSPRFSHLPGIMDSCFAPGNSVNDESANTNGEMDEGPAEPLITVNGDMTTVNDMEVEQTPLEMRTISQEQSTTTTDPMEIEDQEPAVDTTIEQSEELAPAVGSRMTGVELDPPFRLPTAIVIPLAKLYSSFVAALGRIFDRHNVTRNIELEEIENLFYGSEFEIRDINQANPSTCQSMDSETAEYLAINEDQQTSAQFSSPEDLQSWSTRFINGWPAVPSCESTPRTSITSIDEVALSTQSTPNPDSHEPDLRPHSPDGHGNPGAQELITSIIELETQFSMLQIVDREAADGDTIITEVEANVAFSEGLETLEYFTPVHNSETLQSAETPQGPDLTVNTAAEQAAGRDDGEKMIEAAEQSDDGDSLDQDPGSRGSTAPGDGAEAQHSQQDSDETADDDDWDKEDEPGKGPQLPDWPEERFHPLLSGKYDNPKLMKRWMEGNLIWIEQLKQESKDHSSPETIDDSLILWAEVRVGQALIRMAQIIEYAFQGGVVWDETRIPCTSMVRLRIAYAGDAVISALKKLDGERFCNVSGFKELAAAYKTFANITKRTAAKSYQAPKTLDRRKRRDVDDQNEDRKARPSSNDDMTDVGDDLKKPEGDDNERGGKRRKRS